MEIACNSNCPGDFTREDAITSNNGLALLASLTLKNALKINSSSSNSSNNNNNYNNLVFHNHNKIINQQQQQQLLLQCNNKPQFHLQDQNEIYHQHHQSPLSTTLQSTALASILQKPKSPQQPQQQVNDIPSTSINALQQLLVQQSQATPVGSNRMYITTATPTTDSTTTSDTVTSVSSNDATTALREVLSASKINKTNNSQTVVNANTTTVNNTSGNYYNSNSTTTATTPTTTTIIPNTTPVNPNKYFQIPSDILDDLASRFIINVPGIEQETVIRVCFQIELAHWFYLDFFCMNEERKLQPCGIKHFATQLFEHIPFLRQHMPSIDKILEEWKNYKLSVPTYGAILISEDLNYCLLVQSYFAKSSWGFPKGKVNENEDPVRCAQREVYEETGFDITQLLVPNDFIESVYNYQVTRLYIVHNVPLETKFTPRTRNEIKSCDWFPIDSLPVNKNDAISKAKLGLNANSFFMIIPFVKRLKKWIHDKRNGFVDATTNGSDTNNASPTQFASPLNVTQNQQKYNTTGKKQKQRNNNNNNNNNNNHNNNNTHLNYNSDDNQKALKSCAPVQRALSYSSSVYSANLLQNHHCKQQQLENHGNSSRNNELSTTITPTTTATVVNCTKRQRHKSMGDLDGIKFINNFQNTPPPANHKLNNNNNNNTNKVTTKSVNATIITTTHTTTTTTTTTTITTTTTNEITLIGQQKRNSLKTLDINQINQDMIAPTNNNTTNTNAFKRQLFHSQHQNGGTPSQQQQQQPKSISNDVKTISSFELIRREKQQQKAALVKAQKQQKQQSNNTTKTVINNKNNNSSPSVGSGRIRAKSQSDNIGNNNNNNRSNMMRLSKQKSSIITNNSGGSSNNNNKNRANNNNVVVNHKINDINVEQVKAEAIKISRTPTPPPISGGSLLAFAAATVKQQQHQKSSSMSLYNHIGNDDKHQIKNKNNNNNNNKSITIMKRELSDLTKVEFNNGTNVRILQRSTSHQPTTQQQVQQQQRPALQFTPSFNSWTNFTFTKNFIANVFC